MTTRVDPSMKEREQQQQHQNKNDEDDIEFVFDESLGAAEDEKSNGAAGAQEASSQNDAGEITTNKKHQCQRGICKTLSFPSHHAAVRRERNSSSRQNNKTTDEYFFAPCSDIETAMQNFSLELKLCHDGEGESDGDDVNVRSLANCLLYASGHVLAAQPSSDLLFIQPLLLQYFRDNLTSLEDATRMALSEWSDAAASGALWADGNGHQLPLTGSFLLRLCVQLSSVQRVPANSSTSFLLSSSTSSPAVASFAASVLIDGCCAALERCMASHTAADATTFNRIVTSLCTSLFPTIRSLALFAADGQEQEAVAVGRRLSNRIAIIHQNTSNNSNEPVNLQSSAVDYAGSAVLIVAGCWMVAVMNLHHDQQQNQDINDNGSIRKIFDTHAEHVVGQVAIALRSRLAGCKGVVRRALRSAAAITSCRCCSQTQEEGEEITASLPAQAVATALSKSLQHWGQVAPSRRAFVSPPDPHALNFDLLASAASTTTSRNVSPVYNSNAGVPPFAGGGGTGGGGVQYFNFLTPTVTMATQQQQMIGSASIMTSGDSMSPIQQ